MKLGVFTETRNTAFVNARRRIQPKIVKLKEMLVPIKIPGRYDNVLLTIKDEAPSVIRVTTRGKNDDIYEVDVGYDFSGNYPPEDDVLVIQLLEEKLEQVIESSDAFKDKKEELLKVISDWTTEAIGA